MPKVTVDDSAKVGRDWLCFSFKRSKDNSRVNREIDDLKDYAAKLEARIKKVEEQIDLQQDVNGAVTEVVKSLAGEVVTLHDRIAMLETACTRAKNGPKP